MRVPIITPGSSSYDFDMFRARKETHFLAIGILCAVATDISTSYAEINEKYTCAKPISTNYTTRIKDGKYISYFVCV